MGLRPLARVTSLIPGAKIDGRGNVGKEAVDKGWPDNFLTGEGFGQNLRAAPTMQNRCVVEKGEARPPKCCHCVLSSGVRSFALGFHKDKYSVSILQLRIYTVPELTLVHDT